MLVGAGAKVDARDVKRQTPLMRAVRGGHEDAVRVLLAANAAPSARDDQKRGSLHRAVRSAAKGQVRLHAGEFLTDFGFFCFFFFGSSFLQRRGSRSLAPRSPCATQKNKKIFEMLLKAGASTTSVDYKVRAGRAGAVLTGRHELTVAQGYSAIDTANAMDLDEICEMLEKRAAAAGAAKDEFVEKPLLAFEDSDDEESGGEGGGGGDSKRDKPKSRSGSKPSSRRGSGVNGESKGRDSPSKRRHEFHKRKEGSTSDLFKEQ